MTQTRTRTRNQNQNDPETNPEPPSLPTSLDQARALIAAELSHPGNLGVEIRPLTARDGAARLLIYIRGLADADLVERRAVRPLRRPELAPAASIFTTTAPTLEKVIRAVVTGDAVLLKDGEAAALVVETSRVLKREAELALPPEPHKVVFGLDLMENLAMVRNRIRDPALVARPVPARAGPAASRALLYLKDRAVPALVGAVARWAESKNEAEFRRGEGAGRTMGLGRFSTVMTTQWPDHAAHLLDQGYVILLADRVGLAYIAPVTLPALLTSPGDSVMRRPAAVPLRALRVLLAFTVLSLPGVVISVLNYHEEMIPTPFLLALTATRESSAFPVVFEVLLVELVQEVFREASFRLPIVVSPGNALIAGTIFMLLLVQTGLLGPIPVFAGVLSATAALTFPSYQALDLLRTWKFLLIAGAMVLGLYGMTVIGFVFACYLFRHESFGVPFIGESGLHFDVPGKESSARV